MPKAASSCTPLPPRGSRCPPLARRSAALSLCSIHETTHIFVSHRKKTEFSESITEQVYFTQLHASIRALLQYAAGLQQGAGASAPDAHRRRCAHQGAGPRDVGPGGGQVRHGDGMLLRSRPWTRKQSHCTSPPPRLDAARRTLAVRFFGSRDRLYPCCDVSINQCLSLVSLRSCSKSKKRFSSGHRA